MGNVLFSCVGGENQTDFRQAIQGPHSKLLLPLIAAWTGNETVRAQYVNKPFSFLATLLNCCTNMHTAYTVNV